jgi:hypothetical protein
VAEEVKVALIQQVAGSRPRRSQVAAKLLDDEAAE